MSLARTISRGAFLNARFGVNGTKNASRSFGTVGATCRGATDIRNLLETRSGWCVAAAYTSEDTGTEWRVPEVEGRPVAARRTSAAVPVGRQDGRQPQGRSLQQDAHSTAREIGSLEL